MATVFSTVEAAIADDLMNRFPNEFDFDAMLRKVCEDADVDIVTPISGYPVNSDEVASTNQKYKLKGLWLSMEKAYNHLVTTLALYGTRYSDGPDIDLKSENLSDMVDHSSIANVDSESNTRRERRRIPSRKILANAENKRTRRPRKSAVQNRKVDLDYSSEQSTHKKDCEKIQTRAEENANEIDTSTPEPKTSNTNSNEDDNENSMNNDIVVGKENNGSKIVTEKIDGEEKMDSVSVEEKGEVVKPETRKRGRPKVYNDEGVAEFPCTSCSFVARKRTKLRTHMLRMHLSPPSSCDMCNKVFPNKRYMLRHRASHVGPQHCCDICGKMYKIRKAMLHHRKTHDSNYQRPTLKCSECPKSFSNQYTLDCHVRDIHQGLKKSYLCSTCGKSFTTKHSLTEHSNAHSGVKPHACDMCEKTFSYESALRDHKFSHMESKHFWCKHCQKGFSQRSGLKMHMRTHRLNKMFVCSECDRGFTQKQALQRHERVHKGEKPFICKYCGRFFTDASIIRRHLILVHKVNKSAETWREDIICTVLANREHHVQKVSEEEKIEIIEKQKRDIEEIMGHKNKAQNLKGPSRAFNRTYPRRVAVLDEEGNVIAPPEVATSSAPAKSNFNIKGDSASSTFQIKSFRPQSPPGTSIIFTPEPACSLEATHVLNPRFLDSQQWDAITSQLSKGTGTHIEHIILEDTGQHDIHKGLDPMQGIHKIIKYEAMQTTQADSNAQVNVLHPGDYQTCPSPRSSPVSFNSLSAPQSRALETQFEPLAAQIAHNGGQFFDNRSGSHSNAQWPSMYYYTQLATLGVGINSEYSFVNANASGASSSNIVGPYVTHTSADGQPDATTTLILSKDNAISENETSHHRNFNSNFEVVKSTAVSQSLILPHQTDLISPRQLQAIKLDSVSTEDAMHSTEIILHQDISNLGDDKAVHDISLITDTRKCHELKEKI